MSYEQKGAPQDNPEYKPFVPGPNPELPEYIRRHTTPYNSKHDTYDVAAFDRDIVVDKAAPPKAIYDMHTYWSKKHWAAIREYIRHYLPEKHYPRGNGLVLDCFSGSGMTGVAAMMEDRPCVLIDVSPVAAFISHCYTQPVDPDALQAAYNRMITQEYPPELKKKLRSTTGREIRNLTAELDWLFETRCDRCGGKATTEYVVYSERFQCPKCSEIVPLCDCPEAKVAYLVGSTRQQKTELKKRRVCPHCLQKAHGETHRDFVVSTRTKKFGAVPVRVRYKCRAGCKPAVDERSHNEDARTKKARFFTECDLAKIDEIEKTQIPHWFPNRKMMDVEDDSKPWGVKWRAGTSNFRSVSAIYAKRNLWALAAWRTARRVLCPMDEWLDVSLSVASLTCSRMLTEQKRAITKGTYYLPQVSRCIKPTNALEYSQRVLAAVQTGLASAVGSAIASNGSAIQEPLGESTVDYVFIYPPYVGKIQYGELNFVWESWLGFDGAWLKNELVVNPYRGKTIEDWDTGMRTVLAKVYAALKPAHWLSLCYHDTDPPTWTRVQNMLLDIGFEIHTVTVLDPKQKSSNQITAEKVVKSDLVLNCRKARPGEVTRDGYGGEVGLVSHRVRDILIEILSHLGGQTRDRLWDIVLKRLLIRGQMAEHSFDHILDDVAFRSESGRWFLKEEFEALSQGDIKNEEAAGTALLRFTRLRCAGVPVNFAATIALSSPRLADGEIDEGEVENHIKTRLIDDKAVAKKFELGGRMKGVEFYDCLFFYLTRWLKARPSGQTPRRNLAEFLEEYLVHFKDGDKWLYRVPDAAEAEALRKSRQTGLGRRIRQYVAFLRGEGDFPSERRPDSKTLFSWLKHCANFGLAEEGVLLFEKGGMAGFLSRLSEDDRYDAEDYYGQCRRKASKPSDEEDDVDTDDIDGADEE
ncbi:MAG: DNA methyltransferase [Isosphaeraceae bacterium]|jgi:DNA modification methylase